MAHPESRVTSRGRVTVPRAIRDALGLEPGDYLEWRLCPDGAVEVRKAGGRTIEGLVGMLGSPTRSAAVEDMDAGIRRRFRRDGR